MPFGGNDWLALTPEPPLEPELPICDPHHHFWEFRTARIPYQRYLLHELAADITSGHKRSQRAFHRVRRGTRVSYSYVVMYNAFKRLSKGYSAAERASMFHDTAVRVYRIAV